MHHPIAHRNALGSRRLHRRPSLLLASKLDASRIQSIGQQFGHLLQQPVAEQWVSLAQRRSGLASTMIRLVSLLAVAVPVIL